MARELPALKIDFGSPIWDIWLGLVPRKAHKSRQIDQRQKCVDVINIYVTHLENIAHVGSNRNLKNLVES